MNDSLSALMDAVDREQAALATLVEQNLAAEVEEEAAAMVQRHADLIPAMKRLGEATHRLVLTCAAEGVSAELAGRIEAWRQQIAALLGALQERTQDFQARRA